MKTKVVCLKLSAFWGWGRASHRDLGIMITQVVTGSRKGQCYSGRIQRMSKGCGKSSSLARQMQSWIRETEGLGKRPVVVETRQTHQVEKMVTWIKYSRELRKDDDSGTKR